jgi:hypothetical protein
MVLDSPAPLPTAHVVSVGPAAVSEQQPQTAGSPSGVADKDQPTLANCTLIGVDEKQHVTVAKDLTPSHFWLICLDRGMAMKTIMHGLGILIPDRKLSSPVFVAASTVGEGVAPAACDPLLLHQHFPWVLFFRGLGLAASDICTFTIPAPGTDSKGEPAAQGGDIACFVKFKTARSVLDSMLLLMSQFLRTVGFG